MRRVVQFPVLHSHSLVHRGCALASNALEHPRSGSGGMWVCGQSAKLYARPTRRDASVVCPRSYMRWRSTPAQAGRTHICYTLHSISPELHLHFANHRTGDLVLDHREVNLPKQAMSRYPSNIVASHRLTEKALRAKYPSLRFRG